MYGLFLETETKQIIEFVIVSHEEKKFPPVALSGLILVMFFKEKILFFWKVARPRASDLMYIRQASFRGLGKLAGRFLKHPPYSTKISVSISISPNAHPNIGSYLIADQNSHPGFVFLSNVK